MLQALLGFTLEARWLRASAALVVAVIRALAADTSLWTDDVWVVDSTPVECGRSRETVRCSELAGWAQHGYCASQSRFFWGLRLHLIATLGGLPIGFALAGPRPASARCCWASSKPSPA